MPFSNIALNDSFDSWRIKTNQLAVGLDPLISGNASLLSTITLTNPGSWNSNNTINVSGGVIKVGANTFSANAIRSVSNSSTLTISGSGQLGTTIYFDIGTLSTSVSDAGAANIASALSVNTAHVHARAAFDQANSANALANTVGGQTTISWNTANAAYTKANTVAIAINAAGSAFDKANAALPNTTVTLQGSLTVTGNLTPLNVVSHASANVLTQVLTELPTTIWDTSLGQVAELTLNASRIIGAPTNLKKGFYCLIIKQGGVGGFSITSWNATVFKWPGGFAPVLSTAAGATDILTFISNDGVRLYGTYSVNFA